ncbi:hypothetical protein EI545_15955 [Tabrizicola piscis]|uniref:YopX protein domain-containing protein n=1 Tax=Tabrizicola piscis TaxID=2494374 RepID=A0A3S8U9E6_9RHOB|nr:YopX family protein [Tabrizicola piscis]AZL60191.1 hypothetical protein EI545_15955 [Tabrizicola piscis]
MREIKFRAWGNAYTEENKIEMRYSDKYPDLSCFWNLAVNHSYAIDVMQYTGLHDANGKEIYEGDLIECQYCKNEHGQVIWNKEMLRFQLRWHDTCCGNARLTSIDSWSKINGNFYENPKLLEKS